jgi:hypothetical protein
LASPARNNNGARQRRFCLFVTWFESRSHFESKHSAINHVVGCCCCGGDGSYQWAAGLVPVGLFRRLVQPAYFLLRIVVVVVVDAVSVVIALEAACWGMAVFMLMAAALLFVVVTAAADYCCDGDGSVQLLKTINRSVGLMKGEFIVVS